MTTNLISALHCRCTHAGSWISARVGRPLTIAAVAALAVSLASTTVHAGMQPQGGSTLFTVQGLQSDVMHDSYGLLPGFELQVFQWLPGKPWGYRFGMGWLNRGGAPQRLDPTWETAKLNLSLKGVTWSGAGLYRFRKEGRLIPFAGLGMGALLGWEDLEIDATRSAGKEYIKGFTTRLGVGFEGHALVGVRFPWMGLTAEVQWTQAVRAAMARPGTGDAAEANEFEAPEFARALGEIARGSNVDLTGWRVAVGFETWPANAD